MDGVEAKAYVNLGESSVNRGASTKRSGRRRRRQKRRRNESFWTRMNRAFNQAHDIRGAGQWILCLVMLVLLVGFMGYMVSQNVAKLGRKGIEEVLHTVEPGGRYQHFKITFCQPTVSSGVMTQEAESSACVPPSSVTMMEPNGSLTELAWFNLTSSLVQEGQLRCWDVDPWLVFPDNRNDEATTTLRINVDFAGAYDYESSFYSTCFNFLFTFYDDQDSKLENLGNLDKRPNARLVTGVSLNNRQYRLLPDTRYLPHDEVEFVPIIQEVFRTRDPMAAQLCRLSEYLYKMVPKSNAAMSDFVAKIDQLDLLLEPNSTVCAPNITSRLFSRNTFTLADSDLEINIQGFRTYVLYTVTDFIKDLVLLITFCWAMFTRFFPSTVRVPIHFIMGSAAKQYRFTVTSPTQGQEPVPLTTRLSPAPSVTQFASHRAHA